MISFGPVGYDFSRVLGYSSMISFDGVLPLQFYVNRGTFKPYPWMATVRTAAVVPLRNTRDSIRTTLGVKTVLYVQESRRRWFQVPVLPRTPQHLTDEIRTEQSPVRTTARANTRTMSAHNKGSSLVNFYQQSINSLYVKNSDCTSSSYISSDSIF